MGLLTPTRRAEQFALLLESGALTDDPVVEPMVALAEALRHVPRQAGPRPEFRAALRQRLVAVAAVHEPTEPPTPAARVREALSTWRFRRRLAVLAGSVAAVTAVAGVGVSASHALPGDPLYGVKRAAEAVQLASTQGQEAKGKRHLEFAHTRLTEVKALVSTSHALGPASPHAPDAAAAARPATSTLDATLTDMDSQTRAGASDLLAVFRASGRREPLVALDRFTRGQYAGLRAVLPALPTAVQQRAMASLALLRDVWVATYTAAATAPTSGPGGPTPGGASGSPPAAPRHGPKPTTSPAPAASSGSTLGGTTGTNVAPPNVSPIPISPLPTRQLPGGSLPTGSSPTVTTSPLPTTILPLPSVSLSPTSLLGG